MFLYVMPGCNHLVLDSVQPYDNTIQCVALLGVQSIPHDLAGDKSVCDMLLYVMPGCNHVVLDSVQPYNNSHTVLAYS